MTAPIRSPFRALAAALFLFAAAETSLHAASTWRDFPIQRKPDHFRVGTQDFGTIDCIGWACRGALLGEPVHASAKEIPSPPTIYERAKSFRSRPGERMNARHGAEALIDMGLIDDFEVLGNPYEIWDWLKYKGPVAAAIYWDGKMTAHRGSLREVSIDNTTWQTRKAHAITILGWNPEKRAFYFTPNLGTGWGSRGYALLRETDMPFVFVNAVGFVHDRRLSRGAIGAEPPGSRASRLEAAKANVWYTAPGNREVAAAGNRLAPSLVAVGNAPSKTKAKAEQVEAVSKDPAPSPAGAARAHPVGRKKPIIPRIKLTLGFKIEFPSGETDESREETDSPRKQQRPAYGKRR